MSMKWFFPLFLLLLLAPWSESIDLFLARSFYHPEIGQFTTSPFIQFFYSYGELFGWALALLSLGALLCSYLSSSYQTYRKPALLLVVTFIMGTGLITNVLLKDHWGRPRPRQLKEFGGTEDFRPFYSPHFQWKKNPWTSFPSGHAVMGFYFISLAVAGNMIRNRPLFVLGIALALFLGLSLSYARIAQGGHFFSDTVASLVVMGITPLALRNVLSK